MLSKSNLCESDGISFVLRVCLAGLQLRLPRQVLLEPYQMLWRWSGSILNCESCETGFICEKVEQAEPQKPVPPAPARAPPLLQGAGALPNGLKAPNKTWKGGKRSFFH